MSTKTAGRVIALMMIAQGAATPVVNFGLVGPVTKPPGFLINAATHASQLRLASALWFLSGALLIGIASVVVPIFRRYSESMAIWFLALSIGGFLTLVAEGLCFLTMLSLSQQYVQAGSPADPYEALGALVGSVRTWVHYANLLVGTLTVLVLHAGLFRFSLVPRLLSGFGILAASLGVVGILMPMLGYPLVLQLLSPIGLAQLALLGWLAFRGLHQGARERRGSGGSG